MSGKKIIREGDMVRVVLPWDNPAFQKQIPVGLITKVESEDEYFYSYLGQFDDDIYYDVEGLNNTEFCCGFNDIEVVEDENAGEYDKARTEVVDKYREAVKLSEAKFSEDLAACQDETKFFDGLVLAVIQQITANRQR